MAVDVVGYSRLMGRDEAGTLAALKARRKEVAEPAIARHGGRVVKLTGDGALAEFPSAVEAVAAAVEVQREMAARNAALPEDRRIDFRIGINLGDIVIEPDGEIYGDGVNIAARIESLADPGGIVVARNIKNQLKGKLDLAFAPLGPQRLKNIEQPVVVWRIELGAAPGQRSRRGFLSGVPHRPALAAVGAVVAVILPIVAGGAWWFWPAPPASPPAAVAQPPAVLSAPRLSIVVLPFADMGGEPGQEYLADAITENLTTDLSRMLGSFVIASNTAFTYKGKAVDARQVGRELNVRYVLEGSVQRNAERVRVNAQLIDADSGRHLWADRFDKPRGDVLDMQDEITARLARALDVELVSAESRRGRRERPDNPDAVDLAMRGWSMRHRGIARENNAAAVALFEDALRIDFQQTDALLGLAEVLTSNVLNRWHAESAEQLLARADDAIARVLAAAPNHARAHFVKGNIHWTRKQLDAAISEYETAIAADRNFGPAYALFGLMKIFAGRAAEAFAPVEAAIRLSPRDPFLNVWYYFICRAHSLLAQDDKAIEWCRKSIAVAPFWIAYIDLAAAFAWTGQAAEAEAAVAELLKLMPGYTVKKFEIAGWSDNPVFLGQWERLAEGLRKAGLPEE